MYHVTVYNRFNEAVSSRDFEYGTWAEIGFWLDNSGFNHSDYRLEVRFS